MNLVGLYFAYRENSGKSKGEIQRGKVTSQVTSDNFLVKFDGEDSEVLVWIGCMRGWRFEKEGTIWNDEIDKVRYYGGRNY
jgi:hypothetical protein